MMGIDKILKESPKYNGIGEECEEINNFIKLTNQDGFKGGKISIDSLISQFRCDWFSEEVHGFLLIILYHVPGPLQSNRPNKT